MTYIRPDALIFTAVIHKEGDTSDRNPVTYIRPDALIFTAVIHKEGDTSDGNTSDMHKTRCTDLHCCYP